MSNPLRQAHAGMFGLAQHARWYERTAGLLAAPLYRRVARDVAAAGLPAGALVLDVGTGPGAVPRLIAAEYPQVIVEGVDLSPAMIERAIRTAQAEGFDAGRVRYSVADVAHLPQPDAGVDLVVSSLSLHHWEDVAAGLADIRRVLRPGGVAWIYDVRPVLRRVAARARAAGLDVAFEPSGLIVGRLSLRP